MYSQFAYRYALGCRIACMDWAALSWLTHQADLRGDIDRADAYRLLMIWKEVEHGTG